MMMEMPDDRLAPDNSRGTPPPRDAATSLDNELPIDPDLAPDDPGEPSPTHRPRADRVGKRRQGRAQVDILTSIGVGGALGSLARAGIGVAFPAVPGGMPWATLVINLTGSFVLGFGLLILLEQAGPSRYLRPFFATGFLGGYTTFSTFMVETAQLGRTGHVPTAVIYLVTSVVGGLAVSWLGFTTGRTVLTFNRDRSKS